MQWLWCTKRTHWAEASIEGSVFRKRTLRFLVEPGGADSPNITHDKVMTEMVMMMTTMIMITMMIMPVEVGNGGGGRG